MPDRIQPTTAEALIAAVYAKFPERVAIVRERLGRPMTFAEKILAAHADDARTVGLTRGVDYADYRPDRVALQDATAQMALLQFMLAKMPSGGPTIVHCDHLIQARRRRCRHAGRARHQPRGTSSSARSVIRHRFGSRSGIIHRWCWRTTFPGGMMIGTDSHTPNAGGLA